ncbi:hypothetical protein HMPREF1146_0962 [Prevotella sp. MSX73]|nr:hypothetical protein HMPREF0649_01305 [Segatella buccae D17]EJP31165.1 hypothetical protein HMPREF1146_0962 [Prevotella sp. MSX73]
MICGRKGKKYSLHRMSYVRKKLSLHIIMTKRAICQLPHQR